MAKKVITKKATKKVVVKKVPLKKSFSKKPDMPKLLEIFREIKKLMKVYEPPMNARVDIEGKYDLWSEKEIETFGRKYDAMSFVAIIIQTGYVGFYYMPVYAKPEMKKDMSEEFVKSLKGKACFHIRELNPQIKKDIQKALKLGFDGYKKRGWV